MVFNQMTNALYSDSGLFIKTVHCPMGLRPEQLESLLNKRAGEAGADSDDRFCHSCRKIIRRIDDYTDHDLEAAVKNDSSLCVFATPKAKNIVFLRPIGLTMDNYESVRTIQTLRSLEAMDDAQQRGYRLVIKNVATESDKGSGKYQVYQHKITGKLWWSGDFRCMDPLASGYKGAIEDWKLVRSFFYARADRPFPLAAYAVPSDLGVMDRVFLDDVIEEVWGETWNQGSSVRLAASMATWLGDDFKIDPPMVVGILG